MSREGDYPQAAPARLLFGLKRTYPTIRFGRWSGRRRAACSANTPTKSCETSSALAIASSQRFTLPARSSRHASRLRNRLRASSLKGRPHQQAAFLLVLPLPRGFSEKGKLDDWHRPWTRPNMVGAEIVISFGSCPTARILHRLPRF
jgi:hypothetical protein